MDINVISSDIDGAELRREERKNPWHSRCYGNHDEAKIMDAGKKAAKGGSVWTLPDGTWERIFKNIRRD